MNRTIGVKHLPDGTVLRLQICERPDLTGTDARPMRRVQRRVLGVFWRTLPEPLALREALLWNWHVRMARNELVAAYERSVFMALKSDEQLLPLTHPAAERHIVGLYATVDAHGTSWYSEDCHKWLPISKFFSDRK